MSEDVPDDEAELLDPENTLYNQRIFTQEDSLLRYGAVIPELELWWMDVLEDADEMEDEEDESYDENPAFGAETRSDDFWTRPQPQEDQPWTAHSRAYHFASGLLPGQPDPPDFFDFLPKITNHPLYRFGSAFLGIWLVYCAVSAAWTLRQDEKREEKISDKQERLLSRVDDIERISISVDELESRMFRLKREGVGMQLKYTEIDELLQKQMQNLDAVPPHPILRRAKRDLVERITFLQLLADKTKKTMAR